jgi:hypothetical protein
MNEASTPYQRALDFYHQSHQYAGAQQHQESRGTVRHHYLASQLLGCRTSGIRDPDEVNLPGRYRPDLWKT